jgi:hypothetical protein
MKTKTLTLLALFSCIVFISCDEDLLDQINPNAPTAESFWQNENDAILGINAAYAGIQNRQLTTWELFNYDSRSDEGYSQSPWTDLANIGKFVFNNYDDPWNREVWRELYRNVYKCNQVLEKVPNIEMDNGLKERILAEAKFLRGHNYYKLATLWGRVPLVTEIGPPNQRFPQGTIEQVWELVKQDFRDAANALPVSYTGSDIGRATKGGAIAYLGRALMQEKKWAEASVEFEKIYALGIYSLTPNFKDNFTTEYENNQESLFEIQFTNNNGNTSGFPNFNQAGGDEISERNQFLGPFGWRDGQPTKWLLNQFLIESDKDGNVDPRLKYTLIYDHPEELVFGKTYSELEAEVPGKFGPNDRYWRKYTDYFNDSFEGYFSGINNRVIRLADVYLMHAEALNESGSTSAGIGYANLVRQRSNMNDLPLSLSQNDFRLQLRHDRVMELAGESLRFVDMHRYGILSPDLAGPNPGSTPANVSDFDTEFKTFVIGKSEYMPIPLREIDSYGGELSQNPGW